VSESSDTILVDQQKNSMCLASFVKITAASCLVISSLSFPNMSVKAEQSDCIITEDGATMCGKPTTGKPQKNKKAQKSVNSEGFIITLKGCRRDGSVVTCELNINNKGKEGSIKINGYNGRSIYGAYGSKIVDANGKTHNASRVDFDGSSNATDRTASLTPGIDYAASLTFDNMPEMNRAQLLSILIGSRTKVDSANFRNILIAE
jgi:hypothetical protein